MLKKIQNSFLIAEIGWNFLCNLKLAEKMIKSAKNNGADAVKFQIWDPKFLKAGKWDQDGRKQIYQKAYLDKDKYLKIKNICKKNKIICFASAFNMRAIRMLKDINEKIVKIPSHEAYNFDLINYALKNFKLVFLSVGALKQEELKKIIKLRKNKNLIPLHCVSGYPLESQDCNFFKMEYLKKYYKNFGYSGHFSGIQDAIYAMCNGAKFIEKHFTINKNLPGRDNKFALDPNELNTLSKWKNFIRDFKIKKGLGLQKVEMDIYKNYRGRWGK